MEDHFDTNPDLKRTLEKRGKTQALKILESTEIESGELLFTRQREPLGLGHAVWCARHLVGDEPFAVLLADDVVLAKKPCLQQMIEAYGEVGGNLVAVVDVPREQTNRYGILDVEKDDGRLAKIRGLVEKPEPDKAPSTLSIIGALYFAAGNFPRTRCQTHRSGRRDTIDRQHGAAHRQAGFLWGALRRHAL